MKAINAKIKEQIPVYFKSFFIVIISLVPSSLIIGVEWSFFQDVNQGFSRNHSYPLFLFLDREEGLPKQSKE